MNEEIDFNQIAANFVSDNIDRLYITGRNVLKGASDTVRLRLSNSYKAYLSCVVERYSKGKSFFIRQEPTYLYQFYVPLGVSGSEKTIDEASIKEIQSIGSFIVITGDAGSGKSMMMRHLFLDTISQKERVPILLELRELNQSRQTLIEFIKSTLLSNHFSLDDDYIDKAIKAGHFTIFLDGFDEISHSRRRSVSKEVQQFAKLYDKNSIIVSSRPDHEFSGWQLFSILKISPLTLGQACDLVDKLPFDTDVKSKFLDDLKNTLFAKHKSFLSNPLLLSIMLLTYGMNADIPNKLSIFYNQAYEALFQRHDALKGAYQRDRHSGLDIQDFARVFAAFSIQTYDKRLFQFSRSEALEYIEKSKQLLAFEFNSSDYLSDLLQAVSLMIEDGLLISYAHRSFQEYFSARFIADSKSDIQQKLIDKYSKNIGMDNLINLLYEINPELIEKAYIIPGLEKLEQYIGLKRRVGITHYTRYIKADFTSLICLNGQLISLRHGPQHHGFFSLINFSLNNCGYLVDWSINDYERIHINSWKNYGEHGKLDQNRELLIDLTKLSYKETLFQELAMGNHRLSKRSLELALKVKAALIEKHKRIDRTFNEILNT